MCSYSIPRISESLTQFAKKLGCVWIGAVAVTPKPHCKELDCHNNTIKYVDTYGGTRKIGYYFVENGMSNQYIAILHSVVDTGKFLLDITPFSDDRQYNIIGITNYRDLCNLSLQESHSTQI